MADPLGWLDRAPCRDHDLPPDAWFELNQYGVPVEVGLRALNVCLTECPVKDMCHEYMAEKASRSVIAGGGWFNHQGVFSAGMPQTLVTSTELQHILGVSMATIRQLVRLSIIPTAGTSAGGRFIFELDAINARTKLIHHKLKELAEWERDRKAEAEARAERRRQRRRSSSCSAQPSSVPAPTR